MANTDRFDVVVGLNLRLQLQESARLSNHHVVVALEVPCSALDFVYKGGGRTRRRQMCCEAAMQELYCQECLRFGRHRSKVSLRSTLKICKFAGQSASIWGCLVCGHFARPHDSD